jgi:formiminotetrahydrofolate cyclodeaminase
MQIKRFLENLASPTPTPGGGSASALAGALAASLISMVARLSQKDKGMKKEMAEISRKALNLQKRLLRAVEEDAKSFDAVMRAFRLPKNTEAEKRRRVQAIQRAYQKATVVPQQVCQHSIEILELSKTLLLKGNPNAFSDAGVATFLADTALAGGLLNVRINLISLTEKSFVRKMNSLTGQWERKRNRLGEDIRKAVAQTQLRLFRKTM